MNQLEITNNFSIAITEWLQLLIQTENVPELRGWKQ